MKAVSIVASGMLTGVGLSAPASCAAIRCAINNFTETRFMDGGGEWIIASQVPLEQPWRGRSKLLHMVVPAIRECLSHIPGIDPDTIPLLLCVAERTRPGRLDGLDDELVIEIRNDLGINFHPDSVIIPEGRVAGAYAMKFARDLLYTMHVPYCLIAGVDSYLVASTLAGYEDRDRLLTSKNSNGFIPGEAAAAVLVALPGAHSVSDDLVCTGMGFGSENATVESEEPLRADGLVAAIRTALSDAECTMGDLDYRITGVNGEQYWFKEAALAVTRTLRTRKELFDIWHPADCIGEVGAASAPAALAVALAAARKNYAPGPRALGHFSSDDSARFAVVLAANGGNA
jgi:3-oxoacyl-[acyl-carrier-protein] synthase I